MSILVKSHIHTLIFLIISVFVWLHIIYTPLRTGEVHLKRASSSSTLVREGANSGIIHIKADTVEMAAYTQGFAHAQDRLW